jgi:sulfur-oxidizing protein SoxY
MLHRRLASPSRPVSRRSLLRLAAATAGLLVAPRVLGAQGDPAPSLDALHRPRLRVPAVTSNGARVPLTVEAPYPIEPDHGVSVLEVVNPRDPVAGKGVFRFTPASGRAYVAFQARFDEGSSAVVATARCGRHGPFSATAPLVIAAGGGGCAGGAPTVTPAADDAIRPPVIRIPGLVAEGVVRADEIIRVQVKARHPNRTGLAVRDGRFVQDSEPFHLIALDVVYGDELVSRFVLTAALSDNPLITFLLRVQREGTVRVTLTNTRGQRFEASHPIRFA